MSDLRINNITNRNSDGGPVIAGVSTVSSGQFVVPVGPTEQRGGRGRGVFSCGYDSSAMNIMNYITIATTGNAIDFGDYTNNDRGGAGVPSSSTRGVIMGGAASPSGNDTTIEYVTISSSGGVSDFGDLYQDQRYGGTASDSTRGIVMGGLTSPADKMVKDIQYVTIASTGDSSEFGEILDRHWLGASACSPTRGVMSGGRDFNPATLASGSEDNVCQYITIQTKGNAQDFGDLGRKVSYLPQGICSSTTRGIIGSGYDGSNNDNVIEYITIATLGNATDFGDTTAATRAMGALSSTTRGIFAGGSLGPARTNVIQYVTIASTGNATDFGDTTTVSGWGWGMSDSHGGLG